METLTNFWLPILLSAVFCHFASAILWMASPLHKHDYKNPGDKEKSILDFIRSAALAPGVYYVPWCGHGADRKKPEVIEKMKAGPYAMITVMPGMPNMGKSMGLWLLNLLLIGFGIAYIAGSAGMDYHAHYMHVFKVCGLIAFMAHAGNALTMSIWMGQPWSQVPGRVIDALIYAALTAGTFGWLWPKAVVVMPAVTGG